MMNPKALMHEINKGTVKQVHHTKKIQGKFKLESPLSKGNIKNSNTSIQSKTTVTFLTGKFNVL